VVFLNGIAFGWRLEVALVLVSLSLGLAALSFWDDLQPLPSSIRFCGHALVALVMLYVLGWPRFSLDLTVQPAAAWPALLSGFFLFLWLTGYTNAFNFMDGINGIAAGQACITGIGMAVLAGTVSGQWISTTILFSMAVGTAALGFLPHNFPPAKMFMGDVGSAPLGFLLAVLVVWLSKEFGWWLLVSLSLLHANFVLDTTITLLRRIVRKEKWYSSHREHFYQRLIRSGKSHAFVTGWEMALQVVVLGLMVFYLHASVPVRVGLIGLVILIWLIFFAYAEREFKLKAES
jgi:UDP-N-acetylmuramyl pentapeptide phosphotransferase/UDP-N-acetylglucosamine-1-phosphate transferase